MNEILLSLMQSLIIISLYYIFANKIIKKTNIELYFFNFLFFYHLLFVFIYFTYSSFEISDARTVHYFSLVDEFSNFFEKERANVDLQVGQPMMILILRYLFSPLQITFFSGTVLFGMISLTGMMVLYSIMKETVNKKDNFNLLLVRIFFFFPSLHFWQMSMSKDALVFFCIALFILFQKNLSKYLYYGILSLVIIFLIRPYLLPILLTFTYINFLLDNNINKNFKIVLCFLSIIPVFFILQISLSYVGINLYDFDLNNPYLFFEQAKTIISESRLVASTQSAGIKKENLNLAYQMFIYLFGPMNLFSSNLLYQVATIENLVLFFYIFILFFNKKIYSKDLFRLIVLATFFTLLILLSIRTANYGISMRQKWMIIPFLIIFLSNFKKKSN